MIKTWVLFRRQDNNRIGVIPKGVLNQLRKDVVLEEFSGTLEEACERAEQIEFASVSCS